MYYIEIKTLAKFFGVDFWSKSAEGRRGGNLLRADALKPILRMVSWFILSLFVGLPVLTLYSANSMVAYLVNLAP